MKYKDSLETEEHTLSFGRISEGVSAVIPEFLSNRSPFKTLQKEGAEAKYDIQVMKWQKTPSKQHLHKPREITWVPKEFWNLDSETEYSLGEDKRIAAKDRVRSLEASTWSKRMCSTQMITADCREISSHPQKLKFEEAKRFIYELDSKTKELDKNVNNRSKRNDNVVDFRFLEGRNSMISPFKTKINEPIFKTRYQSTVKQRYHWRDLHTSNHVSSLGIMMF